MKHYLIMVENKGIEDEIEAVDLEQAETIAMEKYGYYEQCNRGSVSVRELSAQELKERFWEN